MALLDHMKARDWKKILLTAALAVMGSAGVRSAIPHNQWTDLGLLAAASAAAAAIDPRKQNSKP
jgi:hypothetical protein